MSLFESNYVSLSTDSQAIVKSAEAKVDAYKTKLNESYSVKLALQEKIDLLETNLLITNRTQNLTETNKMKVRAMFEGKSYTEVEKKIGTFIEVLEERDMLSEVEDVTNDDIFIAENEEETVVEDKTPINETEDDSLKIRLEKINEYL
jgi:nitrous oxide reductase